jgi:uncharacterized protein YprB with RNaseH-like and TPR domain
MKRKREGVGIEHQAVTQWRFQVRTDYMAQAENRLVWLDMEMTGSIPSGSASSNWRWS